MFYGVENVLETLYAGSQKKYLRGLIYKGRNKETELGRKKNLFQTKLGKLCYSMSAYIKVYLLYQQLRKNRNLFGEFKSDYPVFVRS